MNEFERDDRSEPRPRRRSSGSEPAAKRATGRRTLAIVLLISLGAGAMFIFCCGGVYLMSIGWDSEFRPGDERYLLQVDDVERFLGEELPADSEISLSRTAFADGSYEIESEYDATDGAVPLYFVSSLNVEPTAEDAEYVFAGAKVGVVLGAAAGSGDMREQPGFYSWGDESVVHFQYHEGEKVGVAFFGRDGRKVVSILVVGIAVDQREDLEFLIERVLEEVEKLEQ